MNDSNPRTLTINCPPAELKRYLVETRAGIAAILASLQRSGCLVTASFGGGNNFVLTSIVAVSPESNEVILDLGADPLANQRILQATRVTLLATHEHIKIQFYAGAPKKAQFHGQPALSIPFPEALLRFQRREYFRTTTPRARPLQCVAPALAGDGAAAPSLEVIDMSCGGIGVVVPDAVAPLASGQILRGCSVDLAGIGVVGMDLRVCNITEFSARPGRIRRHAGCEFVNMREQERSKIQRFINAMERERRLRIAGR